MGRGGKRAGAGRKGKPKGEDDPKPTKKAFPKRPTGRPTAYTEETAAEICERLVMGESLRNICQSDSVPHLSTVMRWLGHKDHAVFRELYARARDAQADVLFDEILTIADTPILGVKTVTKAAGVEKTEGDMIEHRRLQIDARKWIASKLAPKKYGEKLSHEHSGPAGGPIEHRDLSALSDDEFDQLESLTAKLAASGVNKGGEGA